MLDGTESIDQCWAMKPNSPLIDTVYSTDVNLWNASVTVDGKDFRSGSRQWKMDAVEVVRRKVLRFVGMHRYNELIAIVKGL
jgi:hypothetical protein